MSLNEEGDDDDDDDDDIESLRFIGPHDDTHYIIQNQLKFRVGITSNADCRIDPTSNLCAPNPVTIQTEKDYIGACEVACNLWKTSKCDIAVFPSPTSANCRNACVSIHDIDENDDSSAMYSGSGSSSGSGSGGGGGIGGVKQLNNDGWGWTYVSCLESLIWNDQFDFDSNIDCWKLRSFCRDVLSTPGYDEFGNGGGGKTSSSSSSLSISSSREGGGNNNNNDHSTKISLPVIVALISGIIASIVINCTIRRRSKDGNGNVNGNGNGDGFQRQIKHNSNYGDVQFTPVNINEVC